MSDAIHNANGFFKALEGPPSAEVMEAAVLAQQIIKLFSDGTEEQLDLIDKNLNSIFNLGAMDGAKKLNKAIQNIAESN